MSATVQLMREIGPVKVAAVILVSIVVFFSIILLTVRLSQPPLTPLFSGLDTDDSAKIVAKLETMGIFYEIRQNGTQVMVPRDKVLSSRMALAQDGLPTGRANVGYEIFDKSDSMGVSSFVHNVNLIRALEGELGRTISAFSHVDVARVHLVIPKRDLFSKNSREPSASVVLKMRGNKPLAGNEVAAISHLVATAVPGLNVQKITIVDTQGRPFKKGSGDSSDPGLMASASEEFRVAFEKRMKKNIEELLSRSVGVGRVEAQVNAEIDFDRVVTDSEIFDPDAVVPRSVQTIEERGNSSEGSGAGAVTAANNIPGAAADQGGGAASSNSNERIDEITNFEISKTIKKHVRETGNVKRLSVAVLVDGIYDYDDDADEEIYNPRSEEELENLKTLVKSAIGFDEERGDLVEVINMRFSKEIQGVEPDKGFEWLTKDLSTIVQTLVIGLVIALVIILIVKPMVSKALEITKSETEEAELQTALADQDLAELAEITGQDEDGQTKTESLIDMEKFEERMQSSSLGAINDIIERHPDEALTILRGWLEKDTGF